MWRCPTLISIDDKYRPVIRAVNFGGNAAVLSEFYYDVINVHCGDHFVVFGYIRIPPNRIDPNNPHIVADIVVLY